MWALAATPAAWLMLFGLFILRARLATGSWPMPYRPDPKDLGFEFHYLALLAGLPVLFAATLSATAFALVPRHRHDKAWLIPAVAVAGLTALVVLARIDPWHLFTWLGD